LEIVSKLMVLARAVNDRDPDHPARAGSVTLLLLRGEAQALLRQPVQAEADLRLAQRAAVEQGALPALWRVHAALGKLYVRLKQRNKANTEFQQARAIVQGLADQVPAADLRKQFLQHTLHLAPPAAPPMPRRAAQRESGGLTERERETVALIAEGKSNREIAARLVVSEETVKSHVSHVLTKLGLSSRTQIAAWAVERGRAPKT
jgi:non-specific serine/threonine protein kinase